MPKSKAAHIVVVLDNIRSSENVGSIFRTCDAAGVNKIFLAGITPAPLDRFGRVNNRLAKSALGAEKAVAWERVDSLSMAILKLKKDRFEIVAVEQDEKAIDYKTLPKAEKLAFVFGNEVSGIPKENLQLCDKIVEIPMLGMKESLNVAVTVGIVLFSF